MKQYLVAHKSLFHKHLWIQSSLGMVALGVFWIGLLDDSQGRTLPGRLTKRVSYEPGWEESHL